MAAPGNKFRRRQRRFIHRFQSGNVLTMILETSGVGRFGRYEMKWRQPDQPGDRGEFRVWRSFVEDRLSAEAGHSVCLLPYQAAARDNMFADQFRSAAIQQE
jgi:hypothetical protein